MIDGVLLGLLLVVVPASMMARSLAAGKRPPETRLFRYGRTILLALLLDALLIASWVLNKRSANDLGLGVPDHWPGLLGLGLAVAGLVALVFAMQAQLRSAKAAETEESELFPTTKIELYVFLGFAFVVGISWEVLFRGYLLWSLQGPIGVPLAVAVAACAYGLAHGFKSVRLLAASLISAFLFTAGYALTRNLWWLILIHTALPLLGAFATDQKRRRARLSPEGAAAADALL